MELHAIWFIIPFLLLCGIVYGILRGYIYGAVSIILCLIVSLLNLFYYISGFFLQIQLQDRMPLCVFLGALWAVWLLMASSWAYRNRSRRPSVSICLLVNVFLILIWNILVYISCFL